MVFERYQPSLHCCVYKYLDKDIIMMKTFFFLPLLGFFLTSQSQNTFPATGNVGIGTLSPGVSALYIQGSNMDGGATNSPLINVINTRTFTPAGSGANFAWIDLTSGNGAVSSQFVCSYGVTASAPYNSGSGLYIAKS